MVESARDAPMKSEPVREESAAAPLSSPDTDTELKRRTGRRKNRPYAPPPVLPSRPALTKISLPVQVTFATDLGMDAATTMLAAYEDQVAYLYHFAAKRLNYSTIPERIASLVEVLDQTYARILNPVLLEERTQAVLKQLEELSIDPESIYVHEDTKEFQGTIRSPHGRKFLNYIIDVDRYEALRGIAWMQGMASEHQHASEHYRYHRCLEKFHNGVAYMVMKARRRQFNPLVDSGDFSGRTKAELKATAAQAQSISPDTEAMEDAPLDAAAIAATEGAASAPDAPDAASPEDADAEDAASQIAGAAR